MFTRLHSCKSAGRWWVVTARGISTQVHTQLQPQIYLPLRTADHESQPHRVLWDRKGAWCWESTYQVLLIFRSTVMLKAGGTKGLPSLYFRAELCSRPLCFEEEKALPPLLGICEWGQDYDWAFGVPCIMIISHYKDHCSLGQWWAQASGSLARESCLSPGGTLHDHYQQDPAALSLLHVLPSAFWLKLPGVKHI